jgi:hypothetical protein
LIDSINLPQRRRENFKKSFAAKNAKDAKKFFYKATAPDIIGER